MKYSYDSTGAIFSYFLLTLITIILLPLTYRYLTNQKSSRCDCFRCSSQNKTSRSIPWLLIIAWLTFAVVLYFASTLAYTEVSRFDPYEILKVAKDATEKEMKKAFKKLSLIYHPDKSKQVGAEAMFIEISKAYKALTDNETRAIFDEFGHPDGRQEFELGLALPAWLIEGRNSFVVLLIYCAAFGLGMPYLVGTWWKGASVKAKNSILNTSMGSFYGKLKEDTSVADLLLIILSAQEYQFLEYEEREIRVIDSQLPPKTINLTLKQFFDPKTLSAATIIFGHLNGIRNEQTNEIVTLTSKLVHGLLQISIARNWMAVTKNIINLSQCIVQGVLPIDSVFMQISPNDISLFKSIKSIQSLKALSSSDLDTMIGERKEILKIIDQIPVIKLVSAEYKVIGESAVTPNSYVTLEVKFQPLLGRQTDIAFNASKWWDASNDRVHSPFVEKNVTFVVGLANQSRLITATRIFGYKGQTCELKFMAPDVGVYSFQVFIYCDSFRGLDQDFELSLEVVKEVEEVLEESDDEGSSGSSSDESVVVVKAARKRKFVKKSERQEFDDSDDSSDDSDDQD